MAKKTDHDRNNDKHREKQLMVVDKDDQIIRQETDSNTTNMERTMAKLGEQTHFKTDGHHRRKS